jgi:signal transduction histidine kinase
VTALELISLASQAIYILLFLIVGAQALRRPQRASWDIALFFGVSALIVLELQFVALTGATGPLLTAIVGTLALALPYLLLRLVADFSYVPGILMRAAEAGLLLIATALFVADAPTPLPVVLALVAYFVVLAAYCAIAFIRAARVSSGVTRRRMEAVAAGTVFLGADVLTAGFQALLAPAELPIAFAIGQLLGLLSAVAYFIGFAPPRILRRAWQEPELRAFLRSAASLPRLPDTTAIVRALQDGAAATIGARAAIGLYDATLHVLRFQDPHSVLPDEVGPSRFLVWRVFDAQRAEYFPDAARANPELASAYRERGVASLLIAPISAGGQRLGALEVYTDRPLVFSEDDLSLTQLFADQAAVILESRALIDEAARVRAHEEAARLKEDFISAAAHDLKTPLTTLVAQAQFLERRAEAEPSAPADVSGIKRIVREARRLSALVMELLDASRLEQGRLVGEREPIDLVELAREVAGRDAYRSHRVSVAADAPVVGSYDPRRIGQVIENLVENAVKYSPEASQVRVGVAQQNGEATIDVSDEGIGIPPQDVPLVFDRFHRAGNVDDRRYAGMGLGLYICRGIVEQHGGRIWVDSTVGAGSTFHVALPVGGRG